MIIDGILLGRDVKVRFMMDPALAYERVAVGVAGNDVCRAERACEKAEHCKQ